METNCETGTLEVKNEIEENIKDEEDDTSNDPFAYLNRNDFTSEKFKIELRNLPKYYGMKEIKKLLNDKLKLNSTKIKVPSLRSPWIYICFRSEEDKCNALKILNSYKWKNCALKAEEAKPVPDPLIQKRIQSSNENEPESKKPKLDDVGIVEKMKDATTPRWRLSPEEQLKKKTELVVPLLKSYGSKLVNTNSDLRDWWNKQKEKYNGLPCELLPIRHSEPTIGYRNKCEFSIGINEETNERTIGFRISSYVKGSVAVAPIDEALNVPEKMKTAVIAFQKFVRDSPLEVFSPEKHDGYWRQLTARYGFKTDDLMLIVGINPQNLTATELSDLKNQIKIYFTEGEGKSSNVTSLYFQQIKKRTSQDDVLAYEHVFGETHIKEKLLGRTFRISPEAFFQVNTNAAEILYNSIGELAELNENVTLLDVCCGTGSIGICLSDKCGEVLGLEISKEAIADAEVNAIANNVTNAQFFAGKAEEIISCVAQKATKQEIVAIVDPPRAGLRQDALVQLRKCEKINKLVYVSCNPRGAIKNFVDLGRAPSKIYRGDPFIPVKAVSVDLFPFTNHCELLIYFERQRSC